MPGNFILHQVLFWLKPGWSWENKEVLDAEQATHDHPKYIPQIIFWSCGRRIIDRKGSADFSLIGVFENAQSVQEYLTHDDHQKGVMLWSRVGTWTVSDTFLRSNRNDLNIT